MDITILSDLEILTQKIKTSDYDSFSQKKFKYSSGYYYELQEGTLKYGVLIGEGSYGCVNSIGKYACKKFHYDEEYADEELKYNSIISQNNLKGIIPISAIDNKKNAIMMPLVDGDMSDLIQIFSDKLNDKNIDLINNVIFDIMKVIVHILDEASKKGLYYTDLKLENLLYLITGKNKFRIIVGDIGGFSYYDKNNTKFRGYGDEMATYPPPQYDSTMDLDKGEIFNDKFRNCEDYCLMTNAIYLNKTVVWSLGVCFIDIMKEKSINFFLWDNIYKLGKDKIDEEVNIILNQIECVYLENDPNIINKIVIDNIIYLIRKMLNVNIYDRILLDEIDCIFSLNNSYIVK
jgi:serine/threonine protein kinase